MEVLTTFGVEWKLLVASVFNFLILLFLLNKIVYKPLLATLDERKARIAESMQNADDIEQKLAETAAREKDILQKARLDAQMMLQKAEDHARIREAELLKAAEAHAGMVVKRAEAKMESEALAMKKEIEAGVADLVMAATGMILQEHMPKNLTADYVEKALKAVHHARS